MATVTSPGPVPRGPVASVPAGGVVNAAAEPAFTLIRASPLVTAASPSRDRRPS
jgi:hypothetical protein